MATLEAMPDSGMSAAEQAAQAEATKRIGDCIRRRSTVLDLAGIGLSVLPPKISQLENLTRLDLSDCRLSSVPHSIFKFVHLTHLDLSHNPIGALPSGIGSLTSLTLLDVSHTGLNSLPAEIGLLTGLTRLNLDHNRLCELPPEIGLLSNLTRLYLSHNLLKSIPNEIGRLDKLTRLDISDNSLEGLPADFFKLARLTVLHLSNNPLRILVPEIGLLSKLSVLHLRNTRLEILPHEIGGLSNLTELDLAGNSLDALPGSLANPGNLERLLLHDNPALRLSPFIIGDDPRSPGGRRVPAAKSILDFHFGRQSGKTRLLHEAKLVLLGNSGSGKTSIVRAMRDLPFNESEIPTRGLALCDWTIHNSGDPSITVHVWDFSGHAVTRVLHPLFFSPRNLYVVVLGGRDNSGAEEWLRMIESAAADSGGRVAPVIVALNHWNVPGCRPDPDRAALREKFPFIRGFVEMDCKGKKGIPVLKSAIFREFQQMPWVREPFFQEWDAVRDACTAGEMLTEGKWRELCAGQGVGDEGQQDYLAEIFHHLGLALNSRCDPRLPDCVIIRPEWVAGQLYSVLHCAEVRAGVLRQCDVELVLSTGTDETSRAFLMGLLERFGIAFGGQSASGGVWVLPHIQPEMAPVLADSFRNAADSVEISHSCQTCPDTIVARVISRRHDFLAESREQNPHWRHGVILNRKGASALIRSDVQPGHLIVTVTGPVETRNQLAELCEKELKELDGSDG